MNNEKFKHNIKYNPHHPFLERVEKPIKIEESLENPYVFSIQKQIKTEIIDKYDELIFDLLYEEFMKSDATDLVILDQTEFRRFLMKYLQMYMEEKNEKSNIN